MIARVINASKARTPYIHNPLGLNATLEIQKNLYLRKESKYLINNIDYKKLSALLGKPIVPTVGNKNIGTEMLISTVIDLYEKRIQSNNFLDKLKM